MQFSDLIWSGRPDGSKTTSVPLRDINITRTAGTLTVRYNAIRISNRLESDSVRFDTSDPIEAERTIMEGVTRAVDLYNANQQALIVTNWFDSLQMREPDASPAEHVSPLPQPITTDGAMLSLTQLNEFCDNHVYLSDRDISVGYCWAPADHVLTRIENIFDRWVTVLRHSREVAIVPYPSGWCEEGVNEVLRNRNRDQLKRYLNNIHLGETLNCHFTKVNAGQLRMLISGLSLISYLNTGTRAQTQTNTQLNEAPIHDGDDVDGPFF